MALPGLPTAAPSSVAPATPITAAAPPTALPGNAIGMAATPAALAAAISAMHQGGQASTVLRLHPAELGALAVHIALGQGGQVNVLFIPSTAQAAQLLNSGMDSLHHAMAGAGLNLGQAQVGGQGNPSGGQNTPQGSNPPPSQPTLEDQASTPDGLSAYA